MKKTIPSLLLALAFFCGSQVAHADFTVKNETTFDITIKPPTGGKWYAFVHALQTKHIDTKSSGPPSHITIMSPLGLYETREFPSGKTTVVVRFIGYWKITFE
jgi:hypothetical protein